MRYDDKLNNMNLLIETNIELDDKLYERIMKKRYLIFHEKINIYEIFKENYRTQKSNYKKKTTIIIKIIINQY